MKCPNCNVNLLMTERAGIEVDYCPECRGVWLDRGELDKLIEKGNQSMSQTQDTVMNQHEAPRTEHNKSGQHHPPKKKENFLMEIFEGFGGD